MKASNVFKIGIVCFLLAVGSAALLFSGMAIAKGFVFFFVITGVVDIFLGLLMLAAGMLENDVTKKTGPDSSSDNPKK